MKSFDYKMVLCETQIDLAVMGLQTSVWLPLLRVNYQFTNLQMKEVPGAWTGGPSAHLRLRSQAGWRP